MVGDLTSADLARFRRKIDTSGDCWLWLGETNNRGYGRFATYRGPGSRQRHRYLAHRLAVHVFTGRDPGRWFVLHECDNPPCCNPDHLRLGTQTDNMREASVRGRVNRSGLDAWREARSLDALGKRERARLVCNICKVEKDRASFYVVSTNLSGVSGRCKDCQRARRKVVA